MRKKVLVKVRRIYQGSKERKERSNYLIGVKLHAEYLRNNKKREEIILEGHCKNLGLKVELKKVFGHRIVDIFSPQLLIGIDIIRLDINSDDGHLKYLQRLAYFKENYPQMAMLCYSKADIYSGDAFRGRLKSDLMLAGGLSEWPFNTVAGGMS